MARAKVNTEAVQGAVIAEVEGAVATATAFKAAASEGEDILPTLAPPDADPLPDLGPWYGVVVVVAAKQPSRWRIGRQFTPEQTLIRLEDLTEDEVAALRSDPMLLVTAVKDI